MSSSLATIAELLSEVFDVASKNFGLISKILKSDRNILSAAPVDDDLIQDSKKKKNNLPHISEVWDLEEIDAFEEARKVHGDNLEEICKAVPKRKRSEVKRLLGHYKIAYPLDEHGNIIEYDDTDDEEAGDIAAEEEEEEEEEPAPPPKKQKNSKKEKSSNKKKTRSTKPTVEDTSDSE